MDKEDRQRIGEDIKTEEFGFPIGMPICRSMGKGLYEVRSSLDRCISRVLFCISEDEMVLLHGFIKKSQKTPEKELELALKRKQKLENQAKNQSK